MAAPRSIPVIFDLPANSTRTNILAGIPQRVVDEPSRVDIAMTREAVGVTSGVEIGNQIAVPDGSPSNIVAAVGSLPRFDQDGIGSFGAGTNQEIAIFATNTTGGSLEIRVQVRITSVGDLGFIPSNLA